VLQLTRDGIGERTMNEIQRLHDELDAALAESAPLAWRIAPASCFEDPATGASCAYYHRVWQYLLLLGATSSMRTDTAFLINTLRAELRSRRAARVLICGAADYGLLAHVLWAAMLESATPDITVLDRCDTSLASNRWYARRQSTTVATVNADILKAEIAGTFDVVCTHSFLGWFSPVERRRLVDVWRGLLRPSGIVVTTKRLRDTPSGEIRQKFSAAEAAAFSESVSALASQHDAIDGTIDPAALAKAALAYARGHMRYPMRNRDELVALFNDGGFDIETLDGDTPGMVRDRPSGPRQGVGPRLRIVASRRA
jgi:SAM-dependent methyltransferase